MLQPTVPAVEGCTADALMAPAHKGGGAGMSQHNLLAHLCSSE